MVATNNPSHASSPYQSRPPIRPPPTGMEPYQEYLRHLKVKAKPRGTRNKKQKYVSGDRLGELTRIKRFLYLHGEHDDDLRSLCLISYKAPTGVSAVTI